MPLVSIIVTTYNRKDFLYETINSILNQTFEEFELLVIDNCSDYNFFDFIKTFKDNRIRAFQNPNNGIIAINRNYGIKKAKGIYIAFCDDDDLWVSEKLEKQIKIIEERKVDLVYTNIFCFFEEKKEIITKYRNIDTINKLFFFNHITFSSVLVRKSRLLVFNEKKEFVAIEDYILWIKLLNNNYHFYFIREPLVRYRVLDSTMSRMNRWEIERKSMFHYLLLLCNKRYSIYTKLILLYCLIRRTLRFLAFRILGS